MSSLSRRYVFRSQLTRSDYTTLLFGVAASEHFQAAVASSDDAIISKTFDGIVTSWNIGAQNMLGYDAAEMIGQPILRLIPPERQSEERMILDKLRQGEKIDHFESVRVHKGGRRIDVSISCSPIRDQHGKIIGASIIARDITARKAAEAQHQLTANMFSSANDGILITDALGLIVDVNAAFSRISGYSREEVIGQSPTIFRSSQRGPKIFDALQHALNETGHYHGEAWSRRKDGEAYAGLLTVNVVRDKNGKVQNYVAVFADVTALRAKQEQLEHVAHFDSLTNLPNRILLADRLQHAIALSQRHQQPLAVLYLDLDHFKEINEKYGHELGDKLLISLSNRMKDALRDVDTLARIGGDEFVAVVLDVRGPESCCQLAERILKACTDPISIDGQLLHVTASIGVTIYPQDEADAEQLIRHADRAMFEAKQAGKNRFFLFDSTYEAEAKIRSALLTEINDAFKSREFILHYQPKVNMRTGAVIGAEALIRWAHPQRGILAPITFLPIIENHHLSEDVGRWVLASVLEQMDAWLRRGLRLSVSVNIGARQLQHPEFKAHLKQLFLRFPKIAPGDLELEILETSSLNDIQAVATVMHDCRDLGVRFAVDDFGTGYSSLTYLRRLPAETLKIDQSFVSNMLDDRGDLAIVQGVIGLAAAFSRRVIAEGVETVAIGERLLDLGCELAQGYGIARPMPGDQMTRWLSNWLPFPSWTNHERPFL